VANRSYALQFLSGKLQGEEYTLPANGEILVGRAAGLDLVLLEDMVSRQHAQITVQTNGLVIHDLESTNGTFVNGERIRKARLREGDRILIGASIVRVVTTDHHRPLPAPHEASADPTERSTSLMSGRLEEVPIPDLLQLFSSSRRSGVLTIRGPQGQGRIRLREGNVFHAGIGEHDDLDPMKALCRIVGWTEGDFEFAAPDPHDDFMLELEDSTENLLVQAMYQLDEFRRLKTELPGPEARLEVPRPLQEPLSRLDGLALDILQLAHNEERVPRVLDLSPGTDYETASAILDLLTRGYLVRH